MSLTWRSKAVLVFLSSFSLLRLVSLWRKTAAECMSSSSTYNSSSQQNRIAHKRSFCLKRKINWILLFLKLDGNPRVWVLTRLDRCPSKAGEVPAANLPTRLHPLQFLRYTPARFLAAAYSRNVFSRSIIFERVLCIRCRRRQQLLLQLSKDWIPK